jgi:hypothetical protein
LIIAFNHEINLAHMHTVLFAEHVRHLAVDLDNHQPGSFNHGPLPHVCRAKVEVPPVIHGASFEYDDVDRVKESPVIVRYFSEIQRSVITAAQIVLFALVAGKMPAEQVEMLAFGILFDHSAGTQREAAANFYILQFVFACCQRFIEDIGLTVARTIVQPHA